jgi:hypothetical protein
MHEIVASVVGFIIIITRFSNQRVPQNDNGKKIPLDF